MDSREKVLRSARELMLDKGKDGVRMQEIANHAGVNKGLLHYYFKGKENIFREVFLNEFRRLYGDLNSILGSGQDMNTKLAAIIDRYFELIGANPRLPAFVMFEVNRNPNLVRELSSEDSLHNTIFLLDEEFKRNGILSTADFAFQVLLNLISMCAFPFMMKPMVEEMAVKQGKDWQVLMAERKEFLKAVVINSFRR